MVERLESLALHTFKVTSSSETTELLSLLAPKCPVLILNLPKETPMSISNIAPKTAITSKMEIDRPQKKKKPSSVEMQRDSDGMMPRPHAKKAGLMTSTSLSGLDTTRPLSDTLKDINPSPVLSLMMPSTSGYQDLQELESPIPLEWWDNILDGELT